MKKYTAQTLTDEGYTIENAQITNISLSTTNYCCLSLDLTLKAAGWNVVYGGYCLGKVYPDSYEKRFLRGFCHRYGGYHAHHGCRRCFPSGRHER